MKPKKKPKILSNPPIPVYVTALLIPLLINNIIKITTDAQDIGTGSESLPVNFKGESFQIAFNVRYLLDGLKVIDSDLIKLSCNAPTTPAVFSPINSDLNFTYLVMPIQIRN